MTMIQCHARQASCVYKCKDNEILRKKCSQQIVIITSVIGI